MQQIGVFVSDLIGYGEGPTNHDGYGGENLLNRSYKAEGRRCAPSNAQIPTYLEPFCPSLCGAD
jgi:hypothetical protein